MNITLSEIVNVEQNISDILEVKVTNLPVWALFRQTFLRVIYRQVINFTQDINTSLSLPLCLLNYAMRSYMHNISAKFDHKEYEILFRCSDFEKLYITRGNRSFHKGVGYFQLYNEEIGIRSLQLLTPFKSYHWVKDKYAQSTIIEPLYLKIYGRICTSRKNLKIAKDFVHMLNEAYANHLGIRLEAYIINMLTKRLAIILSSVDTKSSYYNKLFDRFPNIKMAIAEELCYGGDQAIFCSIANERRIHTVEYQHGMITAGHTAYVHSNKLCKYNIYKQTLPEYFLGYGEWWGQQIQIPSRFISIGYPHRTEVLKALKGNIRNCEIKDILVLGQTNDTVEEWLESCAELADALGSQYRIVFRPHPAFLSKAKKIYQDNKKYSKVYFEYAMDLYQALLLAEVVVSESSTGLFEAIGIAKKVFVKKSRNAHFSLPNTIFETFGSVQDLIYKICSPNCGLISRQEITAYWAECCKENYLKFISEILDE